MSNQPDPMRHNIIDWCAEDDIPCTDLTNTGNNSNILSWIFTVGNPPAVSFFKPLNLPNRIFIQTAINLSPDHVTLLARDDQAQRRQAIMLKIQTLAIQLDTNPNFRFNNQQQFTSMTTNTIHFYSTMKKAIFLEKYIRQQNVTSLVLNHLNADLGIGIQTQTSTDTANDIGIA